MTEHLQDEWKIAEKLQKYQLIVIHMAESYHPFGVTGNQQLQKNYRSPQDLLGDIIFIYT